ncbi:hypothetical protein DCAR_0626590 [Daucus carota subsp. sativus]|uniref:Peroxidase n=1 Tax=Daucus carota subsp. sativus TaxID=79200 RepID=A0AAF1B8F4_DAUCS|nr:hypothetical protein DCAR_0626590 [Daucus carota subsp. sativus]
METKLLKQSVCIAIVLFLNCFGNARASLGVTSQKAKPARASKPVLHPADRLSLDYYHASCPQLEGIIQQKLQALVKKDNSLAASIIRLHFHDCFVRGCDASILLNHQGSERSAEVSKTLRGFNIIDEIKSEVERKCPKTVSCADILVAAARDTTIMVGGPFWEVPFGRKDGLISIANEAKNVPHGHENVTQLIKQFEINGLNISCSAIQQRLFNYNNTRKSDPSIDISYLHYLKKKCTRLDNYVHLDVATPRIFDEVYYKNLEKKKGLLLTDQLLYSDQRTASLVHALASQPELFIIQFGVSMVKLGNVGVLTGKDQGQIRLNCNYVNKA